VSHNAGEKTPTEDQMMLVSTSDFANVLLASPYGEIGHVGDSTFNSVYSGFPVVPITGYPEHPIGYFIPSSDWTLELQGSADSAANLSIFADSKVLELRSATDASGEIWAVTANESTLTVHNDFGQRGPYNFSAVSATTDSGVELSCEGITVSAGDSVSVSHSSEDRVRIKNYGKSEVIFKLRIRISSGIEDTVFYNEAVPLLAHSDQLVIPDWRNSGGARILVDSGMTGQWRDTVVIPNNGNPLTCCAGATGNVNGSGGVDLADLSALVSYLTGGGYILACLPEANVNGTGAVDLADLSALVSFLTGGGYMLPSCP
jgi:hypothetical protein